MIPNPLPLDIMGRQTTKEQWEAYEMELKNFKARIQSKRTFLKAILTYAEKYGVEQADGYFTMELDMAESCDAPNKPGYTRANND